MPRSSAFASSSDPGRLGRFAYTYLHIPMVAGIIVTAVGDELVIAHPFGHASPDTVATVLGGPALVPGGTPAVQASGVRRVVDPSHGGDRGAGDRRGHWPRLVAPGIGHRDRAHHRGGLLAGHENHRVQQTSGGIHHQDLEGGADSCYPKARGISSFCRICMRRHEVPRCKKLGTTRLSHRIAGRGSVTLVGRFLVMPLVFAAIAPTVPCSDCRGAGDCRTAWSTRRMAPSHWLTIGPQCPSATDFSV